MAFIAAILNQITCLKKVTMHLKIKIEEVFPFATNVSRKNALLNYWQHTLTKRNIPVYA